MIYDSIVYGVLHLTDVSQAAAFPNHGCAMEIMTALKERMNPHHAVHLISTPVTPRTSNARTTSTLFFVIPFYLQSVLVHSADCV
jgi:hypothetical protein